MNRTSNVALFTVVWVLILRALHSLVFTDTAQHRFFILVLLALVLSLATEFAIEAFKRLWRSKSSDKQ